MAGLFDKVYTECNKKLKTKQKLYNQNIVFVKRFPDEFNIIISY